MIRVGRGDGTMIRHVDVEWGTVMVEIFQKRQYFSEARSNVFMEISKISWNSNEGADIFFDG